MATAEWLSSEYHLPEEAGRAGLYDFYYTPYFLGVAAALDDPVAHEIDLMKAAQIGWTYFIIGYLLKRAKTDPCPMLAVFAKEKDGKAFHDEKLVPAVKVTPLARAVIDVTTSRSSGNRWDYKSFPAGFLKLVGSNSPGNVKSTSSVGVAVVEEPDDTSDNVKDQGDAIGLVVERLKRYTGNKKLIVGGTPAVKGLSKTEKRIEQSDKRVLPVRCHDCGEKHILEWDHVSWLESDSDVEHIIYGKALTDTSVYVCPHCGSAWDDHQRQTNIRNTVFEAVDAGDPLCGWVQTQEFHGVAGFTGLSELYACVPGTSLAEVVREYLNAKYLSEQGDQTEMIKFINQKLGKTYEYESNAPEADELSARAEDYEELTIPVGGLVLTAGVDVQHDRLAIVIEAWGKGEESWTIFWGELQAKTSTTDPKDPVWEELHKLLFTPIKHVSGYAVSISAVSIDASDGTTCDQVYGWVRPRQRLGVMAIKGASVNTIDREIYSTPKKVDHKTKTKAAKHGLQVYIVGTHKAKDLLIGDRGRLTLAGKGPGRMHWYTDIRSDYYEQITSEVKAPHRSLRGKMVWQVKSGVRNEALDCKVYALHAARSIKLHVWSDAKWEALEQRLAQADLFTASAVPKVEQQQTQQQPNSNDWVNTDGGDWIK